MNKILFIQPHHIVAASFIWRIQTKNLQFNKKKDKFFKFNKIFTKDRNQTNHCSHVWQETSYWFSCWFGAVKEWVPAGRFFRLRPLPRNQDFPPHKVRKTEDYDDDELINKSAEELIKVKEEKKERPSKTTTTTTTTSNAMDLDDDDDDAAGRSFFVEEPLPSFRDLLFKQSKKDSRDDEWDFTSNQDIIEVSEDDDIFVDNSEEQQAEKEEEEKTKKEQELFLIIVCAFIVFVAAAESIFD